MSETTTSVSTTTETTTTPSSSGGTPTTTTTTTTASDTTTTTTGTPTSNSSTSSSTAITSSKTNRLLSLKSPEVFRSPCFQAVIEDTTTNTFDNASADFATTHGAFPCVNFVFPQNATKAVFDLEVNRSSDNVYTVKGKTGTWYFIIFLLSLMIAGLLYAWLSTRNKLLQYQQKSANLSTPAGLNPKSANSSSVVKAPTG